LEAEPLEAEPLEAEPVEEEPVETGPFVSGAFVMGPLDEDPLDKDPLDEDPLYLSRESPVATDMAALAAVAPLFNGLGSDDARDLDFFAALIACCKKNKGDDTEERLKSASGLRS
jgi:hypothetical protein